jgi:hypothetical protein
MTELSFVATLRLKYTRVMRVLATLRGPLSTRAKSSESLDQPAGTSCVGLLSACSLGRVKAARPFALDPCQVSSVLNPTLSRF